ncbi:MAG: group 1 glycosyl transferase, partial [Desulfovibrionales bacterium]
MPDVSRMTVLMTTDTVGGVWDYSIELCRNLAPLGIRTILASMGQMPTPDQRASACEVPGLTLQTSTFKLEWMPGSDKDVHSAGEWLLSLERRYMPDVVHINGYA